MPVNRITGELTNEDPAWTRFFHSLAGKKVNMSGSGLPTVTRGGQAPRSPALSSLGSGTSDEMYAREFNADADMSRLRRAHGEMDLEDRLNGRVDSALSALQDDPDRLLFSGRAGARATAMGDIGRGEAVRDAENKGRTASAEYWAPGMRDVRQQQLWDKEREQSTLYPYSKPAADADTRRQVAEIAGQSRVDVAGVNAGARTGASAISALGRASTAPIFPGGEDRANQGMSAILPNVPGQSGAPATGKVFPRARLEEFARTQQMTIEQAQQLIQSRGYQVQ